MKGYGVIDEEEYDEEVCGMRRERQGGVYVCVSVNMCV